ncbi:MAG: AbrB/MazE/SpoVT family DNA-binding domain-containing protein [Pseudomonadota bacterium]|jgi:antitoxin MazE
MRTTVQKWGNSLALRIPKALAGELGLNESSAVDVSVTNGKLVIVPMLERAATLEEFLAQVTNENLHGEIDAGPATGRETW